MEPLPHRPATLVDPDGRMLDGLWAGTLSEDPTGIGPRDGALRRWSYVGAGDPDLQLGAAVVEVRGLVVAFAWCFDGLLHTWHARSLGPLRGRVGHTARETTWFAHGRDRILIEGDGSFEIDVAVDRGRLDGRVEVTPDLPAILVTRTPDGGWNATRKAAGEPARGRVRVGDRCMDLDGGSWRDWTGGRQDRRTSWRWVAAAGVAEDSRRVGVNLSAGMNARGAGENVVWWDGRPFELPVTDLAPATDDPAGGWRASGPRWHLELQSRAARTADERLPLLRSSYAQPVGRLAGLLPDPDGQPTPVVLHGVAEQHEARW